MTLVILTKSPNLPFNSSLFAVKRVVKRILGKKRGPEHVNQSLLKGLNELGVEYLYNPGKSKISKESIVFINASIDALDWAINAKSEGRIKYLVVGPNIVVSPADKGGIMKSDMIDRILSPSQWTKDYWISKHKPFKDKIVIWPAGVDVPELEHKERDTVLIYYKKAPTKLLDRVTSYLTERSIQHAIIQYGKYDQKDYFNLLQKTKCAIFLSESESQGLAFFEAWAHNVPTLVWNRGFWQMGDQIWKDDAISAPYLTEQCGAFFHGEDDFSIMYEYMQEHLTLFEPRVYVQEYFTHKKIAENFMRLIMIEKNDV